MRVRIPSDLSGEEEARDHHKPAQYTYFSPPRQQNLLPALHNIHASNFTPDGGLKTRVGSLKRLTEDSKRSAENLKHVTRFFKRLTKGLKRVTACLCA